jgi:PAS domain S-box-containing protein
MYGCASFSGYLTRADSNWQPVLGWTTDELVGTQIINRVHPDDLDIVVEAIHHLCAGGGALTFECRYLCKDGTYARLTWHVTPHIEHLVMDLAVYRSQPCASR